MIYSGSSCWAHLKEKIIERRSKMSVKAECYQPTFSPACICFVLLAIFVILLPVNTEMAKLLLLHSICRLMCVKPLSTPIRTNTHTQKKAFAWGAHGVINCLSGAAMGFMDRIRLQV